MALTGPYIGVVGPSEADPRALALAEEVGRGLADAGAVIVCGGLGGVMEAACRGAEAAGGLTLGILPGTDRASANPHVQIALPSGLGELRNGLIVRACDALIAIAGAYGTLSEIALALRAGVPVVGIETWELARDGEADEGIVRATDARGAVSVALELASGR